MKCRYLNYMMHYFEDKPSTAIGVFLKVLIKRQSRDNLCRIGNSTNQERRPQGWFRSIEGIDGAEKKSNTEIMLVMALMGQ